MNITKNIQKQRIDHKGPPCAHFGFVFKLWVHESGAQGLGLIVEDFGLLRFGFRSAGFGSGNRNLKRNPGIAGSRDLTTTMGY